MLKNCLSFQELCFHLPETTLLPNAPVSRLFRGFDHVWKKRLPFIPRAVLSFARDHSIAKCTSFKAILLLGSCAEEATVFYSKSCAFICSRPLYCQTHGFQGYFVAWIMRGSIPRAVLSFAPDHSIAKRVSETFCV